MAESKDTRTLSETDSLRLEILDLNNYVLTLNKKIVELQETLVMSQREVNILNEEKLRADRVGFLKKLGFDQKGKISFKKQADGRYEVIEELKT